MHPAAVLKIDELYQIKHWVWQNKILISVGSGAQIMFVY